MNDRCPECPPAIALRRPVLWPTLLVGVALGLLASLPRDNPSAAEEALTFHGDGALTRRLSADQRQLPREVVELGRAKEVVYEAPAGSRRQGLWRHRFGETGKSLPVVVADPRTERIGLVGGAARFDPAAGIRN